jgi:MFS transporter, PAT family, beta-lactamase induction signal transducer AmpG
MPQQPLLRSPLFWIGILYFAEGLPLGIFYDLFPVHFRQQGVSLWAIGFMSLLGLAWTIKFIWAPLIDHTRHHRRWMAGADLGMALVLIAIAIGGDFGPWVWFAIGLFTLLSATNDIAIDGYTIEQLKQRQLGIANGLRIAFYRVGMLTAGFLLVLSDWIGWPATYSTAAILLLLMGAIALQAPREIAIERSNRTNLSSEWQMLLRHPIALVAALGLLLAVIALIDSKLKWSQDLPLLWPLLLAATLALVTWARLRQSRHQGSPQDDLTQGPMFGTLIAMLQRPGMIGLIAFILLFKLGDAAMGFMVKPFWVDAGFSASQIGLVSVNIGLVLSIAGGIVGGWITDRIGIFHALWILGLFQALSNLGYAWAAFTLPLAPVDAIPPAHIALIYSVSAIESFTGGLGTAAFLAFLMAIVNQRMAATEYALLSSLFAFSRSIAGWASGFGAEAMSYGPYFFLTFFLAFPAYLLLPWVKSALSNRPSEKS